MKRILVNTQRTEDGRTQYVAHADGSKKEAVAESRFAAQLYAAKIQLGIRRPRKGAA